MSILKGKKATQIVLIWYFKVLKNIITNLDVKNTSFSTIRHLIAMWSTEMFNNRQESCL